MRVVPREARDFGFTATVQNASTKHSCEEFEPEEDQIPRLARDDTPSDSGGCDRSQEPEAWSQKRTAKSFSLHKLRGATGQTLNPVGNGGMG